MRHLHNQLSAASIWVKINERKTAGRRSLPAISKGSMCHPRLDPPQRHSFTTILGSLDTSKLSNSCPVLRKNLEKSAEATWANGTFDRNAQFRNKKKLELMIQNQSPFYE